MAASLGRSSQTKLKCSIPRSNPVYQIVYEIKRYVCSVVPIHLLNEIKSAQFPHNGNAELEEKKKTSK